MSKASQLLISVLSEPRSRPNGSARGAVIRNWSSFSAGQPGPGPGRHSYGVNAYGSGYGHGGYSSGGHGDGAYGANGGHGGDLYGTGGYGSSGGRGGYLGVGDDESRTSGYGADPYDPYGDPYGMPPPGPKDSGLEEPAEPSAGSDELDEGEEAGLDLVQAGAGLPPAEPDQVDMEEAPPYDDEVYTQDYEEGYEEAPEAGFGEGPPLLLVNNEGQNILAKEKTRQLINKVNILSKSLQAKLPLYDEGTDLPEPEDEMREICRAREVQINKLEQAKTAAEIARLENEEAEPGNDLNVEEEAKKIREEWPGDEYDDHGGYPMAPDAHYYESGHAGYDYGGHGAAGAAGFGNGPGPEVPPAAPAAAGLPAPVVAVALLLPHLRERRRLRPAGFLGQVAC